FVFFFQAEDGIRDFHVTGVQTCALPISRLRQHRYYNVLGILVLQAWSFLGCLLMWQTDPAIDRTHFSHFGSKALIGKVAEEPVRSEERRVGKECRSRWSR